MNLQQQNDAMLSLQRVMKKVGWEIDYLDLDLTGTEPTVDIKISRHDGRWLWARVDQHGRCTLETFQRETSLGESACYGKRAPRCVRHDDVFLGRRKPEGPRAMLRIMTSYIAENPAENALRSIFLPELRASWGAIMANPVKLIGESP